MPPSDIPGRGNAKNNGSNLVVPLRFPKHGQPTPLIQRVADNLEHTLLAAMETLQFAEPCFKNEAFKVPEMIEDQAVHLAGNLVMFAVIFVVVFNHAHLPWNGHIAGYSSGGRGQNVNGISAVMQDADRQLLDIALHHGIPAALWQNVLGDP